MSTQRITITVSLISENDQLCVLVKHQTLLTQYYHNCYLYRHIS